MDILKISGLSKSFGQTKVIRDLNLTVPENTIYGFIGQNGAGKTTTMKMILGFLTPDNGEIFVKGEKVSQGKNSTNKYIGYLPDVPEFYSYMTPMEYLSLCGEITGMAKADIKKRANELLEQVGLAGSNKKIKGFSRGMRQRLGVAQALFNKPSLLICDEPTSALDPLGRKELLDILKSVKGETTVLFSTHILSDVEKICDKIAFLYDGKIAINGTLEEIRASRKGQGLEIAFETAEDAGEFQNAFPDGEPNKNTSLIFKRRTKADAACFMKYIAEHHISIQRFEILEPALEDLYVSMMEQAKEDKNESL
ncbi:MAG: ABC transporter ATP-binding protein [Clostridium sp.]|nr:ABC transporter ATP-binding protein [Clostridium sp.]MCM1172418.1 ABC transporter ATP-binding protein [Clostridium sp.]MCM1208646.1 ABC transporter ATP-binding protein [Ruminococcus sp.]